MPLDPRIPLMAGATVPLQSPLNSMLRVQALRRGQQEEQLNALQMQRYREEPERLRREKAQQVAQAFYQNAIPEFARIPKEQRPQVYAAKLQMVEQMGGDTSLLSRAWRPEYDMLADAAGAPTAPVTRKTALPDNRIQDEDLVGGQWTPRGEAYDRRGPPAQTTVSLPPQENAFEKELGTKQADELLASKAAAEDASQIIETVNVGRGLLDKGAITGTGADFLVGMGKALHRVGVKYSEDEVANSEAFGATMAQNVAKLIKQFGSGTGLSDADREYATKMAGGSIKLNEASIRRILDINEQASRNVIKRHNAKVKGVKSKIPLDVQDPPVHGAALPTITTKEAFDALPSGAEYIGSDGVHKRKR